MIQSPVEVFGAIGKICDPGHIDGHNTYGAGGFTASEEAAGFFAQLPQVQTQAAAHAAHVAGLHVAVDVVGKIRRAVFGGHLKEQAVVLLVRPVEILRDGIGGNGVLKAPAVGIALNHDFDEGLVHHIHFRLAVLVFEVHFLTAHNGVQLRQIVGHHPIQRDVGEGGLGSPAAGGIDAVNKGLDAFLGLVIGQAVCLNKGGQIGVEGGESLSTRPFVLHDAQEVDHLIAQGGQMFGRGGGDLAGTAAQPLLDQLL